MSSVISCRCSKSLFVTCWWKRHMQQTRIWSSFLNRFADPCELTTGILQIFLRHPEHPGAQSMEDRRWGSHPRLKPSFQLMVTSLTFPKQRRHMELNTEETFWELNYSNNSIYNLDIIWYDYRFYSYILVVYSCLRE